MRRTVKAWGLLLKRPDGSLKLPPDFISPTRALAKQFREQVVPRGYHEYVVPVLVIYDDGQPKPAKRRKAVGR